ncbi:hypothetical protein [Vagococcus bubulae]|uniref:PTS EIIC type-1 domain-containing protein n=1 Tax=Vagococcus bubulae TaxID=1977868 RepID=A0A429ZRD1_9ENTE|nr:hypothetical protein [Vagococcus bubulae]RST96256.1 hypothetical protein CBF36_00565 [Vagococcus bubulae]
MFDWFGNSAFYFLPFLLAVSSARKFKVNEFIALCLASILFALGLISGVTDNLAPLKFLGMDLPYMTYSSSVIPIILSVLLMSYIEINFSIYVRFNYHCSSYVNYHRTIRIFTGGWLSKGLIQLFDVSGPVAGGLLAGYNLITPVVITNYTDFANIDVVSSGLVDNSQPLLEVNLTIN